MAWSLHSPLEPLPGRAAPPLRRWAALLLVAAVLMVHLGLLGTAPSAPAQAGRDERARPLQVRRVAPATVVAEARPMEPVTRPGTSAVVTEPAAQPRPSPIAELQPPPPAAMDSPAEAALAGEPARATESVGQVLPRYAVRLAPAATLSYLVTRGAATAQTELRWQPAQDRYELVLRSLGGARLPLLGHTSQGRLDNAGIAPERYVETRRGRELRAVNFQSDAGRITFSGPAVEYPWVEAAQDRLSWMLQLGAVLAAQPSLAEAGREVLLFVAGTRGDAEVWTFNTVASETLDLPAGPVTDAVHLRREPRRPYDTQVDVWLDPARHFLPVRVHLQGRAGGEGTVWLLNQLDLR